MRTIRTLIGCCVAIAVVCQASTAFAQQSDSAALDSQQTTYPLMEEDEGVAQVGLFRHCNDCAPSCDDACDLGDCDSCDGSGCSLFKGHRCRLFGGNYDRCERSTCPDCKSCRNGQRHGHSCRLFGGHADCPHCGNAGCNRCRGLFGLGVLGRCGLFSRSYPSHERLYAPGHGYVLPTKRPMWDVSYPYHHMYNATAVGMANGQYPSSYYGNVYTPTDTTQLGYNYGHVPYWMPRPGMTPPIPHPENMHLRVCLHGYRDGVCNSCRNGSHYSHQTVSQPSNTIPPKPEAAEAAGKALKEVAVEPTLAPIPQ